MGSKGPSGKRYPPELKQRAVDLVLATFAEPSLPMRTETLTPF